ncbi:MAG: serine/threonine protein kinase [Candidatus Obscuribacterales bacterium]|nr:serine/threonine protein kinase [Candidatus Obscuribacterales bacterium]
MLDLEPDTIFESRFRIVRKLGEGGFGIVYEAIDTPLHRSVAIKLLKPSTLSDAQVRRRFLREGKILSGLQSDKLVRLYSVNVSSDGLLYMVMELLSGQTLRARLNEQTRLSEESTLAIARSTVSALRVLQAADVVHRDLKPDNVLLLNGSETQVKLLDFGLSGLLSKNVINDSQVTSDGAMIGSIHYMAPELCMGQKATIRADFYALGCILYECLTGSPPFGSKESTAVLLKHVAEMPPDPALLEPSVSPATSRFLLQLLQKDPALRFQSCEHILKILDKKETTTQTKICSLIPFGASTQKKDEPAKRFRQLIIVSALLILALITCLLVMPTKPESGTFKSPSNFKISALASALTNQLSSSVPIESSTIGETVIAQSDKSDFSQKWQNLLALLKASDSQHSRYLLPETVYAVRELADTLIKAHRWKSALTLLREALNYVASEPRVRPEQKSALITPIILSMAAHKNELTEKEFVFLSGPIIDALSTDEWTATEKLHRFVELCSSKYPHHGIIADARLEKALNDCAEQMPVRDLTVFRSKFRELATHCDERLNHLDKQLIEHTRTLIRIDKESSAKNKEELLGQDYLLMARGYKRTNAPEASRYLAESLASFTNYGIINPEWIRALVESAILKGETNKTEAKAQLLQAEQQAQKIRAEDRQFSLNRILLGWHSLHRAHTDERFSCAEGNQVIRLVRELDRLSKTDPEREAQCCWMLSVAMENHIPEAEVMETLKEGLQFLVENHRISAANKFVLERRQAQLLNRYRHHSLAAEQYMSIRKTPQYQPFIEADRRQFFWELASVLDASGRNAEALQAYESLQERSPSVVGAITALRERMRKAESAAPRSSK